MAAAAEDAGWDGLFVWDHVVHHKTDRRTFGDFGEPTGPRVLAERLDEGLGLLARYWTGEPVDHDGPHYLVRDTALLPPTVQRPRPPVWLAGRWPNHRPMRRAARWDGVVPLFASATHGYAPPVGELRNLVAYVRRHRDGDDPFEIVVGGASPGDPAKARDMVARWPTRAPPGGTNGRSRRATTSTSWTRCCAASSRARPSSPGDPRGARAAVQASSGIASR